MSKYVHADPVTVRVRDEAQAHVGSGVVEVTNKIHRLWISFWTQRGVQFPGSDYLIGGIVWYGTTGRQRNNVSSTHHHNRYQEHHQLSSPYLSLAWVKQRLRSVSTYLRHCCMARGFDSTISTDRGSSSSFSITFFSAFSSSLTKYTPDSSLPCVPPHTATRGNLGKHTTLSTSI